jgi:hypothetical protein
MSFGTHMTRYLSLEINQINNQKHDNMILSFNDAGGQRLG